MHLSKIILIGVTIDESQILSMCEETLSHPLDLYESRDVIISKMASLLKDTVERVCGVLLLKGGHTDIKGGNTEIFSTDVH